MKLCPECAAPLDTNGMTNCIVIGCKRDRAKFDAEVADIRASLTLPIVEATANNSMPDEFVPTRTAFVAVCSLLMETLRQNEEMSRRLLADREATRH